MSSIWTRRDHIWRPSYFFRKRDLVRMRFLINARTLSFMQASLTKYLIFSVNLQIVTSWRTVYRWRTGSVPKSLGTVLITAAVVALMYKNYCQNYSRVIVFLAHLNWKNPKVSFSDYYLFRRPCLFVNQLFALFKVFWPNLTKLSAKHFRVNDTEIYLNEGMSPLQKVRSKNKMKIVLYISERTK